METSESRPLINSRFLEFIIDNEKYCIEIFNIKEIMGMTTLTKVPGTPGFLQGVMNLRGQIIPVIDLRLKFQLDFCEYTERTCIIVVELNYDNSINLIGLIVDSIQEVIDIPLEKLTHIPYIKNKINADYIQSIVEINNSVVVVLDVEKIVKSEEFVLVNKINSVEE